MNDPSPRNAAAPNGAAAEEPPSWLAKLWRDWRARQERSEEVEALRDAVTDLIEDDQQDPGVSATERSLLTNILNLRSRHVSDCMVPRADIVAVDVATPMKQLVALLAEYAHSRIPVYRGTLDEVLGMVLMKDVMLCLAEQRDCQVRDLLRPVLFVAPSMAASKLLLQMRQSRQHMAMVVDEFGGIDGIVTMEDLVEEIVGEIEDEHDDPETPDILVRSDGTLLIDARIKIEEFEARVGDVLTREERDTIDTLGGYVFHLAGHVPKLGEVVQNPAGFEFEVIETDQNTIKRLRVRNACNLAHKTEAAASTDAAPRLAKAGVG